MVGCWGRPTSLIDAKGERPSTPVAEAPHPSRRTMMGSSPARPTAEPMGIGRRRADGVQTEIHVICNASERQFDSDIVARLRRAFEATEPELSLTVTAASRAVADPLRDGGEGLRDFRLAAVLGRFGPGPGDLMAIEGPAGPHASLVKIRPARATSAFAGLMAPPVEGLCALGRTIAERDHPLLALAFAGHALAANVLHAPERTMQPFAARLIERLTDDLARARNGNLSGEERALLAWGEAWCGLVTGDLARLVAAHRALARLAVDDNLDLTPREIAQVHINLAIVALSLGAGREGDRRLAEALDAARHARARIAPEVEPVTAMDLDGLIGEIALGLGAARGDQVLLVEAETALRAALMRAVRVETRARWQSLLDTAMARRKR